MAPPDGHSGPGNRSQHIAPDVPGLDPTLIHADPPVWSRQTCLWPQKGHLWHFGAILGPYGAPQWPFRTREKVPTHRPGCALTWSNLYPHWSTCLELPGLLVATKGPFMAFWAILGTYGGIGLHCNLYFPGFFILGLPLWWVVCKSVLCIKFAASISLYLEVTPVVSTVRVQ